MTDDGQAKKPAREANCVCVPAGAEADRVVREAYADGWELAQMSAVIDKLGVVRVVFVWTREK